MNSQISGPKKLIVRIFCELHVKMGSGSRCLCGVPDPTVEMGEARCRALTPEKSVYARGIFSSVEMGEARCRALTPSFLGRIPPPYFVEMGEARCRALTHFSSCIFLKPCKSGRNGRGPL